MRVVSASVTNFASYKQLDFEFTEQGLTLIQGNTGSGKSTLCDVIPWILFGKTSKGGTVDEILSWPGDEVTIGTITLTLNDKLFQVSRSRGKAKDNDLLIWEDGGCYRGKDLIDTQRIIATKLGMDYDLYLAGSYYHEFSQTAQFFTTTPKNRRTICEQLVDLSLAKKLKDALVKEAKITHEDLFSKESEASILQSAIDTLGRVQESEKNKAATWEAAQERYKVQATQQYDQFESNRKKTISKKCNSCGTVLQHPHEVIDNSINPYIQRLADLEIAANPYTDSVKDYFAEINDKKSRAKALLDAVAILKTRQDDTLILNQVIEDLRSSLISDTIKDVETKTNQLLTDYFDGEIRVEFDVAAADRLEVSITKDGNAASYTQLSKGQRCLLKLCFGVSVMKAVSNHHGTDFSQLFFDESLSGLSEEFKTKAYRLFEQLAVDYVSVFVIDHSTELKSLFHNKITVELINGVSTIVSA